MQNLLDAKLLMKVFGKIEQQGQPATTPVGNSFELSGMQIDSRY